MYGLIFDASRECILLAIAKGKNSLFSRVIEGGKSSSKFFFPKLQSLLQEAELEIKNINYIAVGVGPGSYIGIRNAAIIAKTFSFTHGLPLVSFSSPLAFIPKIEGRFAFLEDAKMNQFFMIKGTYKNDVILNPTPPLLMEKNQYLAHLQETDILITTISVEGISLPIYSPTPNFPLLAQIAYQNFTTKPLNHLKLVYFR